jgi:hypothetical protein
MRISESEKPVHIRSGYAEVRFSLFGFRYGLRTLPPFDSERSNASCAATSNTFFVLREPSQDTADCLKSLSLFSNFAFVYSPKIPASSHVAVRGALVHSLGEAHSSTQPRLLFLGFAENDLLSTNRSAGLPRCQPC